MRAETSNWQLSKNGPDTLALVAASAAILSLIPVAAYQLGYLRHLPDPPSSIFASDKITRSEAAHPLGIPDSLLGIGSYGITLGLLLLARSEPKAKGPLALKLVGDATFAGFNVVRQVAKFGKICSWCTGTALCTAAMVTLSRRLIVEEATAMGQITQSSNM